MIARRGFLAATLAVVVAPLAPLRSRRTWTVIPELNVGPREPVVISDRLLQDSSINIANLLDSGFAQRSA